MARNKTKSLWSENFNKRHIVTIVQKKISLILWSIFAFSVIIRFLFLLSTRDMFVGGAFPDRFQYLAYGEQIADGNWNPSLGDGPMWVAPGIPLIVAYMKTVFNDGSLPTIFFNILVSSCNVFLLYYFGKELFNHKVGFLLSIWAAIYYPAIKFSLMVYKEALLYFLVPLTLYLVIKSLRKEVDLKNIALSSLSYAVLIHIDERFIIYLPILPILFLIDRRSQVLASKLKSASLWMVLVILLMVPWTLRNYHFFDQLVIISTRTTPFTSKLIGENIYGSDNEHSLSYDPRVKKFHLVDWNDFYVKNARQVASDNDKELRYFNEREARVKALINYWQPVYFKPNFIMNGYRVEHWLFSANIASIINYGIFLPFYFFGLVLLIRRKKSVALFIAILPILHSLVHAFLIMPLARYRLPMDFIVAAIGLWAICEIYHFFAQKREQKILKLVEA